MSESSDLRAPCPGCGKSLRFPPGTPAGKKFKCPRCATRVTVPGAAPQQTEVVFLATCPACAQGRVVPEKGAEEETFACTHCKTRISETMLGFLFLAVDEEFVPNAAPITSQVFTRPQLKNLSEEAARSGASTLRALAAAPPGAGAKAKTKPSPPASEPAEDTGQEAPKPPPPDAGSRPAEETEEGAEPDEPTLSAKDLLEDLEQTGEGAENDEDLWWEVDEEALAERGGKNPSRPPLRRQKPGKKGSENNLNVDDLLDELR